MATATTATSTTAKKTYKDMIADAITTLKERNGSSRQAIKKYIQANNDITANFDSLFNNALKKGVSSGNFAQPKGPSGPVKLVKISIESKKPTAAKPSKKAVVSAKKAAPKKAVVPVKKLSPKKAIATTTTKKNLKAKSKMTAPKKAVVSTKKSAKVTKNPKAKKIVPKKTITKKTVKKSK